MTKTDDEHCMAQALALAETLCVPVSTDAAAAVFPFFKKLRQLQYENEALRTAVVTTEKWRGLAMSRDGDGRTVQSVQSEAAAVEREACAKVAAAISDKYAVGHYGNEVDIADEIQAAIRARGYAQKTKET